MSKYLYLLVLLTSLGGYRYVIFGLHAAPRFANIFILIFWGYILMTMTKYICLFMLVLIIPGGNDKFLFACSLWSAPNNVNYLCGAICARYCMNAVFEFI